MMIFQVRGCGKNVPSASSILMTDLKEDERDIFTGDEKAQ
jgi:hypothetical protein